MRHAITTSAVIAATISSAVAQACAPGAAKEIGGNWYCDAVKAITYSDFGSTGFYNKITNMDGGNCQSEPFDYSGALAPMDGEVRNINSCTQEILTNRRIGFLALSWPTESQAVRILCTWVWTQ